MGGCVYTRKARSFGDKVCLLAEDTYAHVFWRITYVDCFRLVRTGRFHFVGRVKARHGELDTIEMEQADQGNGYD